MPKSVAATIDRIADRIDALMVCESEQADIAQSVVRLADRGRPVIALATQLGAGVSHVYFGPDNVQAGRVAGDLIGRLMGPGGGNIVLVAGLLSMRGQVKRREGFRAALAERYPGCRVVAEMESAERGERADELATAALTEYPETRGIYNASVDAQEIGEVLRNQGRCGEVTFITLELTKDTRVLLRSGVIDTIVDQDPAFEIRTAVAALAARFGRLEPRPNATRAPVHVHMIEKC